MQVLVADDESTTRLWLERVLGTWGYDVVSVEDGSRALRTLRAEGGPRLAILDWMMPGLDGVEVCRRLRETEARRHVYTLLVTHRTERDDLTTALDSGADDFVRKPLDPAELKSRLAVGRRVATYEAELERVATDMERLAESRAQQLVHADRMATLGVLSAGIAHEINNPATFISGNVQTLKRFWGDLQPLLEQHIEQAPAAEAAKLRFVLDEFPGALDGIHDGVRRISRIVKGLRTYARKGNVPRASCDVPQCVERAIELCRFRLSELDVSVDVAWRGEALPVTGDTQELEQLFVNLIVNAVDAMAALPRRAIRFRGESSGGEVVVVVEDTGPGISPKLLERIWEPFFTTKPAGVGTGLGLAICRKIAEGHGGRLTADNASEGGARFRLVLPTRGGTS